MNYQEELELIKAFGCEDIEYTSLVNNYFISFTYNQKRHTAEHILSVYGSNVDFWELSDKAFSTLPELLDYIK